MDNWNSMYKKLRGDNFKQSFFNILKFKPTTNFDWSLGQLTSWSWRQILHILESRKKKVAAMVECLGSIRSIK